MAEQRAPVDARVLIAIGSNQGNSVAIARAAMDRLATFARDAFVRSSLWRTSPVDCPPGSNDYVNAVVAFEPIQSLTPERLLHQLKRIELEFGRAAVAVRNAPRELDLDLLVFGAARRATADFTLPHPRATNRRFVLVPAAEVAPDLVWPGTGRTIRELLVALDSNECVELLHDQVVASDDKAEGRRT